MVTSVQCLPERLLVHYQFQMLNFRRLNLTDIGVSDVEPWAPGGWGTQFQKGCSGTDLLDLNLSLPAEHRSSTTPFHRTRFWAWASSSFHFQEANSDYLGPLIVTPEMVAKKIKAMKDNKSPGVDGSPPKLLMDHYSKRVREISQRITDQ